MDGTALAFGLGEHFTHGLQHTKALVANHQFDPVQATATQPLEEAAPTGLALLHTSGGAKDLTISVSIDRNCCQNSLFKFSSPVPAQIDAVHVNIWKPSALQRTVSPVLNVNIRFPAQFANRGG